MNDFLSALNTFSKALFPNRCELCGEVIELDKKLCDNCLDAPVISDPLCKFCGCSEADCTCKKHKNEYKRIVAPYYYRDVIVSAIHRFKDDEMPFLSNKLAKDMYDCVLREYSDIEFDLITYVPLRKLKQQKRGFNQSALLAERISKLMNVPVSPLLVKTRYTGIQHHKTAAERKAAAFGSYDVAKKYKNELEGKNILLIDDVKTTGSTLNECAKMLKIYSAKSVYCAVAAITCQDKNKQRQP